MKLSTLSKKLAENLKFFTDNPNRRCVDDVGFCYYTPHDAWGNKLESVAEDAVGCFVGKLLPTKVRNKLKGVDMDVCSVLEDYVCPTWMSEHSKVLSDFQTLHDDGNNWGVKGLSENGKDFLNQIIENNGLNREDFEFALG